MDTVSLKNVLTVIQRTINCVDNRLLNHGEQVGYICLRMGLAMGYSEEQLLPLCALATVHDIGAYKVEERKRMVEFEVDSPHEHAVYGSLFLQHFGPFRNGADLILYHHWRYEDRHTVVKNHLIPPEAFLIHLADRVSVLYAHSGPRLAEMVRSKLPEMAGTTFAPDHVALLVEMAERTDLVDRLVDGSYMAEFCQYLDGVTISPEEAISYLTTLVYAIEFRSRQTVTHSVSVASAAMQIAELVGLPESEMDLLRHAALLHDVGKITTPLEILTKPGRLTDIEMGIMRRHAVSTAEIMAGTGLDRIGEIASNHHERLNGKGYPRGLGEHELCAGSRILAVADMLTALVEPRYYKPALCKDDVLGIMARAVAAGDIDGGMVALVRDSYDRIAAEMETRQRQMLALYDDIAREYDELLWDIYSVLETPDAADRSALRAA